EPIPSGRELVAQAEQSVNRLIVFALQPVVERLDGGITQQHPTRSRQILQVQDDVGHRLQVELRELMLDLDPERADSTAPLEREVAVFAEVQLEGAGVVLRLAGGD